LFLNYYNIILNYDEMAKKKAIRVKGKTITILNEADEILFH